MESIVRSKHKVGVVELAGFLQVVDQLGNHLVDAQHATNTSTVPFVHKLLPLRGKRLEFGHPADFAGVDFGVEVRGPRNFEVRDRVGVARSRDTDGHVDDQAVLFARGEPHFRVRSGGSEVLREGEGEERSETLSLNTVQSQKAHHEERLVGVLDAVVLQNREGAFLDNVGLVTRVFDGLAAVSTKHRVVELVLRSRSVVPSETLKLITREHITNSQMVGINNGSVKSQPGGISS